LGTVKKKPSVFSLISFWVESNISRVQFGADLQSEALRVVLVGWAVVVLPNVRLGIEGLSRTNTLAFYSNKACPL